MLSCVETFHMLPIEHVSGRDEDVKIPCSPVCVVTRPLEAWRPCIPTLARRLAQHEFFTCTSRPMTSQSRVDKPQPDFDLYNIFLLKIVFTYIQNEGCVIMYFAKIWNIKQTLYVLWPEWSKYSLAFADVQMPEHQHSLCVGLVLGDTWFCGGNQGHRQRAALRTCWIRHFLNVSSWTSNLVLSSTPSAGQVKVEVIRHGTFPYHAWHVWITHALVWGTRLQHHSGYHKHFTQDNKETPKDNDWLLNFQGKMPTWPILTYALDVQRRAAVIR